MSRPGPDHDHHVGDAGHGSAAGPAFFGPGSFRPVSPDRGFGTPQPAPGWSYSPDAVLSYPPRYDGYPLSGAPVPHPKAPTVLVLGLVGVLIVAPVGIAAIPMGARVRREIDAQPLVYSDRTTATVGYVLGIISLVITVLWVPILILMLLGVVS